MRRYPGWHIDDVMTMTACQVNALILGINENSEREAGKTGAEHRKSMKADEGFETRIRKRYRDKEWRKEKHGERR